MNDILKKFSKQEMRSTIAFITIVGVFVLIGALIFKGVPEVNGQMLYMSFGLLLGAFNTVYQYYFGSSKGESDKQKSEAEA